MLKEIHYGKVVENDDPLKQGRLKVQINTIVDSTVLSDDFIPATFPFAGSNRGFFFIPEIGSQVEVEIEHDQEKVVEEINARWRGVLYSDVDEIPDEFKSDPINRAGIKYGDNVLLFDQTSDLLSLISNNVRLGEEDASHPLIRGDVYNTEEATLLTDISTTLTTLNVAWTAIAALPPPPVLGSVLAPIATPVVTSLTTLITKISIFLSKQQTWLSTKVKTE